MKNEHSEIFFQHGIGIGPFQMMNEIGDGKFGKVYLGINEETKEKVAIKQIEKSKNIDLDSIHQEINIHKILIHPYLCKMYYVVENPTYIFIVTEYCSGGEIFKNLMDEEEPYEEKKACKIFSQILSGLEYLHNNNISHRDIKLENMLFDEYGDAKLTDFGLSKSFEGNIDFNDFPGSPIYAAPEVLCNKPYKGYKADIWSMGISLYMMVCGDFPFIGETIDDYRNVVSNNNFELPEFVSPLFKDFINKILEKNPNNRLTISQIKEHPWMKAFNFNFMKSPGIIINKDILPIDIEIIKDIAGYNEVKIRNVIKDILMNKHNNNTVLYYLKIEILKRDKKLTISDIRPSSELFLKYINNKESKLENYDNNINKKIDELTKKVLNDFKMKEHKIREKVKNSLNIGKSKSKSNNNGINNDINNNKNNNGLNNNNNNDNNINNINNNNKFSNKKKLNKKINKLRSKTFRFEEFNNFFKKEEQKEEKIKNEEIIKKNKLELLNQYIGPLLFIHDIIDEIITNVVKLKNTKQIKMKFIPANYSSLNIFATKKQNNTIFEQIKTETINFEEKKNNNNKFNNIKIDTIEEIQFSSTINNADRTFSFEFYKPKHLNNNINNKNMEKKEKNKKNDIGLSKNYKQLNKFNKVNNSFIENRKDKRPINELKKSNNNNYEKKIQKNKNEQLSYILSKKNISKVIKEINNKNEKSDIIRNNKNKLKRSLSQKYIFHNKRDFMNNEDINTFIKDKRRIKSEKKYCKIFKIFKDLKKDKDKNKEGKNDIKYIKSYNDKNKGISKKSKRNININDNLNINEILSEKRKNRKKENNGDDISIIKKEKKNPTHKNYNLSQINFYNKKLNDSILNSERKKNKENINTENDPQKTKKNTGRKLLIIRNKKKNNNKDDTNDNNDNNDISTTNKKDHQRRETTPIRMIEKPKNKEKDNKSFLFTHNKTKTTFCQTGRNQKNKNLIEKYSTNDSSAKKQINCNDNKNTQFKKLKSHSIHLNNIVNKIGIKVNDNKNDVSKNEIKTKKSENLIRNIIIDYIGYNNITISNLSKNHIKFACKMYLSKKKVMFNLNLMQKEKNRNIISGDFIEGDINNYEKIFATIKSKLE